MQGVAIAHGGVVHAARFGLGIGNELADRFDGQVLRHHQNQRRSRQHADAGKVRFRVIGQLVVEQGIDGQAGGAAHEKGVAIGRRLRHKVGRHDGVPTGLVLHHHRLAQCPPQMICHRARQLVGGTAWGIGHHQLHGFAGVRHGLRLGLRCATQGDQRCQKELAAANEICKKHLNPFKTSFGRANAHTGIPCVASASHHTTRQPHQVTYF